MRPPETRFLTCPFCGAKQYAVITRSEGTKDDDWDDGACLRCSAPIVSVRCGSIFLIGSPTQIADEPRGRKRTVRLRRLIHLEHIHPLAPERRKALIEEARAARQSA
jgi:hypothetical protein